MHRLLSSATALLIALSVPIYSPCQPKDAAATASPIEVTISGPRLIHVGDTLNFKATLTNRSDKPLAVMTRTLWSDPPQFTWRITDMGGRLLPPPDPDPMYGAWIVFFCPVTSLINDFDIKVLQPGEKMDYPIPDDPSDFFAFTGKGFYRVALTYALKTTRSAPIQVHPYRRPDEIPEAYTPQQKIDMYNSQPPIQVTSKDWIVYLTE
jgi:hypothetical protein